MIPGEEQPLKVRFNLPNEQSTFHNVNSDSLIENSNFQNNQDGNTKNNNNNNKEVYDKIVDNQTKVSETVREKQLELRMMFSYCCIILFVIIVIIGFLTLATKQHNLEITTLIQCTSNNASNILHYPTYLEATYDDSVYSSTSIIVGKISTKDTLSCTFILTNDEVTEGYITYYFDSESSDDLCVSPYLPPDSICTQTQANSFTIPCSTVKTNPEECENSAIIDNSVSTILYIYSVEGEIEEFVSFNMEITIVYYVDNYAVDWENYYQYLIPILIVIVSVIPCYLILRCLFIKKHINDVIY